MGVDKNQSGIVTGREIKKNRDKSRSTRILQVQLTAIEDVQTIEHITQTGEDTSPVDGSQVIILDIGQAWKIAIATDDKHGNQVAPGEKKIYSTDDQGDAIEAFLHLKNDGTIEADNGAVNVVCSPDGDVTVTNIGETLVDSGGAITLKSDTSITLEAPTLKHNTTNVGDDHTHSGVERGSNSTDGPS